jgi:hypothetical protein
VLLVVFVGVGVWTFYQQPDLSDHPAQERLDELMREQERIYRKDAGPTTPLTDADEKRLKDIQEEVEDLQKELEEKRNDWARNTSIILLSFATVLMAVSLLLPDLMRVFSNGFLLGGMFTLIYGTGWSFAGGDSRARFYVVFAALVLSVGFGYLRFIRGRKEKAEAALIASTTTPGDTHADTVDPGTVASLAARVTELERRAAAAAAALGSPEEN